MPTTINILLGEYVEKVSKIYGEHLKSVILYGSYARRDFITDSDIDIMVLIDLTDTKVEMYHKQLLWAAYNFNQEHGTDIKPITKSDAHFKKWLGVYSFYTNVQSKLPKREHIGDLVRYRILKEKFSILMKEGEYRGPIVGLTLAFFTQYQLFMH